MNQSRINVNIKIKTSHVTRVNLNYIIHCFLQHENVKKFDIQRHPGTRRSCSLSSTLYTLLGSHIFSLSNE